MNRKPTVEQLVEQHRDNPEALVEAVYQPEFGVAAARALLQLNARLGVPTLRRALRRIPKKFKRADIRAWALGLIELAAAREGKLIDQRLIELMDHGQREIAVAAITAMAARRRMEPVQWLAACYRTDLKQEAGASTKQLKGALWGGFIAYVVTFHLLELDGCFFWYVVFNIGAIGGTINSVFRARFRPAASAQAARRVRSLADSRAVPFLLELRAGKEGEVVEALAELLPKLEPTTPLDLHRKHIEALKRYAAHPEVGPGCVRLLLAHGGPDERGFLARLQRDAATPPEVRMAIEQGLPEMDRRLELIRESKVLLRPSDGENDPSVLLRAGPRDDTALDELLRPSETENFVAKKQGEEVVDGEHEIR